MGSFLLLDNTIGSYNTAICFFAATENTTGSSNTSLGYNSNLGTTTANNTICIGSNANCNNYTDSTAIGYNATNTANNQVMLGSSAETVVIPGNASITGTINSISNDIFSKIQYLSTVSSNVQTQISNVASNKTFNNGLFASDITFTGSINNISNTIFGYLFNVSSDVQNQINTIKQTTTDIQWIQGTINRTNIGNACSTSILTFSTSLNNISANTFRF